MLILVNVSIIYNVLIIIIYKYYNSIFNKNYHKMGYPLLSITTIK